MIDGLKVLHGIRSNTDEVFSDVMKRNPSHVMIVFSEDGDEYDLAITNNLSKAEIIGLLNMTAIHMALQDTE